MAYPLIPAFTKYPAEAAVVGRLLAGYGELEYILMLGLANSLGSEDRASRTFFGIRGEAVRLDVAYSLMRDSYGELDLSNRLDCTVADLRFCRNARNTFAHCHWAGHHSAGLFYVDLQASAERKTGPWRQDWLHVDMPLLQEVEAFFLHTKMRLYWIDNEFKFKKIWNTRYFSWSKGRPQPKLHNPREQHVPPWQSSDSEAPPEGPLPEEG